MEQFANGLFGYNASTFKELFNSVAAKVESGEPVSASSLVIGSDTVNVLVDARNKTVIFSIAVKK
ncbi:hypothetical protein D3C78_1927070 [compost metagenome]